MPVITFKYKDLRDLGIDMEKDELIDTLPMSAEIGRASCRERV